MMKKAILIAIFAICIAAFTGKGTASAETAEANYKFYCGQCHGADGKGGGVNAKPKALGIDLPEMGTMPRNHTNPDEMSKLSDADITNAIAGGGAAVSKSALMPPFGKTLTDAEIKDLTAYLRKLCKCTAK